MKDYESLLERIRQSPIEHLGRRSVSEVYGYFIGYKLALDFWGQPNIHYRLEPNKFKEWLDGKVHLCRQNLQTFCLLLAEDEREAFDLYFEFYHLALEECKEDLVSPDEEKTPINLDDSKKSGTLVDFIFNENFRAKPAMYFGNHRWVSSLWAMCSGFIWAEKDLGIENSSDQMNMELFQIWLEERYPIAKGRTWDRIFYFHALNSESWALKEFYEHFEMFLEGDKPEAMSKTHREIVENAIKHAKEKADNE